MNHSPVIHWFRRDLRVLDNLALHAASDSGSPILPLFIFDPRLLRGNRFGAARMAFLLKALESLDETLRNYQTRLLIRFGDPLEILSQLVSETQASALYFNRDYSPTAYRRDAEVEKALSIRVHAYDDAILVRPGALLKGDGTPYTVFTPFKKAWNTLAKPAISERDLRAAHFYDTTALRNDGLPSWQSLGISTTTEMPSATESYAQQLLNAFVREDAHHYSTSRNWLIAKPYDHERPHGTSYLSPYLRLGLISPRATYWSAREAYAATTSESAQDGISTWVSELTWREFYMHILHHYPHVLTRDFVRTYDALAWRDAPEELARWKEGMTGYPVVDAAMRQLRTIGWLPNRARMIVASFMTKDLLIHWREGDYHFMQHLIDGDPAANNGGWQWTAGTGTDASPYFRIFNPVEQSRKFATPDYLRTWLPELATMADDDLHTPWLAKFPPKNYPTPMIDHALARERTLQAFKLARGETVTS